MNKTHLNQSPNVFSSQVLLQIIKVGEEVLEEIEFLGSAGVGFQMVERLNNYIERDRNNK